MEKKVGIIPIQSAPPHAAGVFGVTPNLMFHENPTKICTPCIAHVRDLTWVIYIEIRTLHLSINNNTSISQETTRAVTGEKINNCGHVTPNESILDWRGTAGIILMR